MMVLICQLSAAGEDAYCSEYVDGSTCAGDFDYSHPAIPPGVEGQSPERDGPPTQQRLSPPRSAGAIATDVLPAELIPVASIAFQVDGILIPSSG